MFSAVNPAQPVQSLRPGGNFQGGNFQGGFPSRGFDPESFSSDGFSPEEFESGPRQPFQSLNPNGPFRQQQQQQPFLNPFEQERVNRYQPDIYNPPPPPPPYEYGSPYDMPYHPPNPPPNYYDIPPPVEYGINRNQYHRVEGPFFPPNCPCIGRPNCHCGNNRRRPGGNIH